MMPQHLRPPPKPDEFFPWLKKSSEEYWRTIEINESIFGFQIQKGTRWLTGLTHEAIADYEYEMGLSFPESYKAYLSHMNGTDTARINVYSKCGEPYRYSPGYYSYPRDLEAVKEKIEWIHEEFGITPEFIEAHQIPRIMPIVSYRFLVMDRCAQNPILSMYGRDSIFFASSLESFLLVDIFNRGVLITVNEPAVEVKFWLD
jgi:hypothetical protein